MPYDSQPNASQPGANTRLIIGAHPSNFTLTALAHEPALRQPLDRAGIPVAFDSYAEGRLTEQFIADGRINVGGTGSTRAIATQAAGVPIVYLASSHPRTTGSAMLVRADSGIHQASDLRGGRIGLVDGSFHTAFLCTLLDSAGLRLDEVERIDLQPAASRQALLDGQVDAWIAMDPHLRAVSGDPALRILRGCEGVIPNRSVFWAHRSILSLGPDAIDALISAIAAADDWIAADTARAARLFSSVIGRGVDATDWDKALAGRRWGILPAGTTLLEEQQAEADLLARHGLLPHRLDLAETTLSFTPSLAG
jgi:sulfonate transport system substrate-binding protein